MLMPKTWVETNMHKTVELPNCQTLCSIPTFHYQRKYKKAHLHGPLTSCTKQNCQINGASSGTKLKRVAATRQTVRNKIARGPLCIILWIYVPLCTYELWLTARQNIWRFLLVSTLGLRSKSTAAKYRHCQKWTFDDLRTASVLPSSKHVPAIWR